MTSLPEKSSPKSETKNKKTVSGSLKNAAITSASVETVNRYGSASAEFIKAYSGVDNETGQILNRSLKKISQGDKKNIRQQAGFSAEVLSTAKKNKDAIINKDSTRYARSEDVAGYGKNNDTTDIVTLDKNGNVISQSQMKFVNSPNDQVNEIVNGKSARYLENDIFEVPTEQVEEYREICRKKYEKLSKQADRLEQDGNIELAQQRRIEAQRAKELEGKITDSGLTKEEALAARTNPEWTVAKEMLATSHEAGVQGAKVGVVIGGAVATVTNVIAVISGEKEFGEAVMDTAKISLTSAGVGYGTAFAGSTIKSIMQQSGNATVRALSKTGMPAAVVSMTVECSKSIIKYAKGEITGTQLCQEMGLTATGLLSASVFATLGQVAIPIPVLGAMIGGMVGYMLTNSFYTSFFDVLKNAKLAKERRIDIEQKCAEAQRIAQQYERDIKHLFDTKLAQFKQDSEQLFALLNNPQTSDDDYCSAINQFAETTFGKDLRIKTSKEFELLMLSDDPTIF